MTTYHTLGYLREKLKEAGLPHNRITILRWENEGRLVSPKSTTNFKSILGKKSAVRLYTDEQIAEIIEAFKPGGTGKWSPSSDGGSS